MICGAPSAPGRVGCTNKIAAPALALPTTTSPRSGGSAECCVVDTEFGFVVGNRSPPAAPNHSPNPSIAGCTPPPSAIFGTNGVHSCGLFVPPTNQGRHFAIGLFCY